MEQKFISGHLWNLVSSNWFSVFQVCMKSLTGKLFLYYNSFPEGSQRVSSFWSTQSGRWLLKPHMFLAGFSVQWTILICTMVKAVCPPRETCGQLLTMILCTVYEPKKYNVGRRKSQVFSCRYFEIYLETNRTLAFSRHAT